jgi:hypothetical protein
MTETHAKKEDRISPALSYTREELIFVEVDDLD